MKTKIEVPSKEVKTCFMSLYYVQNIARYGTYEESGYHNVSPNIANSDCEYLELKRLSEISDEDAIEVARILDLNHLHPETTRMGLVKTILRHMDVETKGKYLWLQVFDFLRSKGYLISFREYSESDILSFGWAKYSEIERGITITNKSE